MVDWKKEVKLSDLVGGKKKQQDAAAPEAVEAVVQADKPEQTSIWKKELSFGRKKQPKAEPVEDTPEVEEQTLELDAPAAVELVQHYAPEPVATEPHVELVPEPVEQVFPVAVPDLEPDTDVQFVDLLTASLPEPAVPGARSPRARRPRARVPAPAPVAEPPIAAVAAPAPAPSPAAPAAAPVVVHPPVSAAQLPPLPDEPEPEVEKKKKVKKAPRVPFYKRDLSFGRKPKSAPEFELDDTESKAKKLKRKSRSFSIPRPAPRAGRGGKHPKRLVGLKIGASQLAAATVSNNGHAEVLQLARGPLDAGIVSNGELREPELLADALKEFFKVNKLPKRGVRLGIATNRIGVRTLEIPGIQDAKQLANAIKFRAQEALPIPIDEAVLDYQVLSETTNEEGEISRRILLVLAYRDLIDRYVAACKKAGIQLVGIDLEAFALLRAIAAPRDEGTPAQAALVGVTVGHDRTTFAVSDGRTCEFTRVLDWGGHSLNVGLARALDMAPSEVDRFKPHLSLTGNEVPEG